MHLQGLTSLEVLALERCSGLRGALPALQGLRRLRRLSLHRCTGVSAAAVLVDVAACAALSELRLSWCKGAPQQAPCERRPSPERPWVALRKLDAACVVLPALMLDELRALPAVVDLDLSDVCVAAPDSLTGSANACDSLVTLEAPASSLAGVAALTGLTRLSLCRLKVRCLLAMRTIGCKGMAVGHSSDVGAMSV